MGVLRPLVLLQGLCGLGVPRGPTWSAAETPARCAAMGKKRKDSDDDKKKKKKDKDKKKKEKKKKEKKKAKKEKKKSSSSSSSSSDADAAKPEDVLKEKAAGLATATAAATEAEAPPVNLDSLPPVEEGILRFEFSIEEVGPLGLRFSGGSPPMILSVAPDSFAKKKAIPANHEVRLGGGEMK